MLLRAPNVVPPTPPVGGVLPLEGPLIVGAAAARPASGLSLALPRAECAGAATAEGARLVAGFFAYQGGRSLTLRRLILAPPGSAAARLRSGVGTRARKRSRAEREAPGALLVPTCGCTFGCTLGNIVGYLQGRGLPAERAHVLHRFRATLAPAGAALDGMTGADAAPLRNGYGALLVVGAQREHLPELAEGCGPKLDARYGRAHVAVGAAAAILGAFGVMSAVEEDCRHFERDGSLAKVLRCAEAHLRFWKPAAGVRLPTEHWAALQAERRAVQRAVVAAEAAAEAAQADGLSPPAAMATQLARALAAAYPSGHVDAAAHGALCTEARRAGGAPTSASALGARTDARTDAPTGGGNGKGHAVVPLAQIPGLAGGGGALGRGGSSDDSRSVASSSWHTLSSVSVGSEGGGGSGASVASADSLDAVLVQPLGAVGVG